MKLDELGADQSTY